MLVEFKCSTVKKQERILKKVSDNRSTKQLPMLVWFSVEGSVRMCQLNLVGKRSMCTHMMAVEVSVNWLSCTTCPELQLSKQPQKDHCGEWIGKHSAAYFWKVHLRRGRCMSPCWRVSLCWRHFRYYSCTLTFHIVSKILFHSCWSSF